MAHDRLLELTEKLLKDLAFLRRKFEEVRTTGEKGDFFKDVKPFADEIDGRKEEWKSLVLRWLKEMKPANLHENQIVSVCEQIETLSVQAFYPETSRKRFLDSYRSALYILQTVHEKILEEG